MANSLLSPTVVTNEALRILHNSLKFAKGVNRDYDKMFANSGVTVSGKAGTTLRARKPNRYTVTEGANLVVQDQTEDYVTITCATQKHVGMKFSSNELTMTIDAFSDRYLKPAVKQLANEIDKDGLQLYKDVYNSVGAYGSVPATALVYLQAAQKLDEYCTPRDGDRFACIRPATVSSTVNAFTTLLNPTKAISDQYTDGEMGEALGFKFVMDQNCPVHTVGNRNKDNDATCTAYTSSTLTLSGVDPSGAIFRDGDTFTVSTCYAVNPESKDTLSHLQQFVITADCTATSTTATISVSPSIVLTGATKSVSATPVAGLLDFASDGTASANVNVDMAYHRSAFTLVTADLVIPKNAEFASRQVDDGMALRVIRMYDIQSDHEPCRVDCLYGWTTVYPEAACRIRA